jgi:hypothetical protein
VVPETVLAVYWSSFLGSEGHFAFLTAVRADGLVHLPWGSIVPHRFTSFFFLHRAALSFLFDSLPVTLRYSDEPYAGGGDISVLFKTFPLYSGDRGHSYMKMLENGNKHQDA